MISTETAEHFTWADACDGWQLVQGSGLSVLHERMPPGTREARHLHRQVRQFFVLKGGTL